MTDKKENILLAALELFAKEGYNATSTSKIAKRAGVSEGLIFRHFINKDGLLEAILKQGEEKAKLLFADVVFETDPIEVINKTMKLSEKFIESKEVADFWKLQYKIKWEIEHYNEQKMEAMEITLTNAFTKLGYAQPQKEARFVLIHLDGLVTRYFLQKNFDLKSEVEYFRNKYKQ